MTEQALGSEDKVSFSKIIVEPSWLVALKIPFNFEWIVQNILYGSLGWIGSQRRMGNSFCYTRTHLLYLMGMRIILNYRV